MQVELLWFECANPQCGFIPLKTKKEKIKVAWKYGRSIQQSARRRIFLSYVRGEIILRNFNSLVLYRCQYGDIVLYDETDREKSNSQYYPITGERECIPCTIRKQNERSLRI